MPMQLERGSQQRVYDGVLIIRLILVVATPKLRWTVSSQVGQGTVSRHLSREFWFP